ncbi:hypothetical protein BS78_07G202900 [Paspalum vaginatum]|nr:hypothetical protein BS78_07G202900 [Paspalum vaginatum]
MAGATALQPWHGGRSGRVRFQQPPPSSTSAPLPGSCVEWRGCAATCWRTRPAGRQQGGSLRRIELGAWWRCWSRAAGVVRCCLVISRAPGQASDKTPFRSCSPSSWWQGRS